MKRTVMLLGFCTFALMSAAQETTKYPISLKIMSAKRERNGVVSVQHASRPAYCNNPQPGLEAGFCSTYNPADTVSEGSTLILTAVMDSKTYTLSCARCGMLEVGDYPARRDGLYFMIFAYKLDKHGNRKGKGTELKLGIIGEESQ